MKNKQLVTQALEMLRDTMAPWLCQQIKTKIDDYTHDETLWWEEGVVPFTSTYQADREQFLTLVNWDERTDALDVQACCNVFDGNWNNLFCHLANKKARSWNRLVQSVRNDIAHLGGNDYSDADTTSALDNISRLAGVMDQETMDDVQALYRKHVYGSEGGSMASVAASDTSQLPQGVLLNTPIANLPCWRDVIEPHPDVAQGRYRNAEFAADLAQVARGEGAYEYRDPVEFFSRTYVTEGMKGLLIQALRRVGGLDGEPVIQLKTAFGGGKTHSMLALYHLLHGRAALSKMPEIKRLVSDAGLERLPVCRIATLVGTALDPSRSRRPANFPGNTVNTLWGEMAYQLAVDAGNPRLYDIVKESDKKGVSPGSVALKELFDACGPCVVLIDELVAYAKKLWKKDNLPAGTFDNLITFVQEVTEAARASKNSLVVASIPESEIEVGEEEGGKRALEAIEHTFGRLESIWKPVGANEGFEIVRRRLFLGCKDEDARDAVCAAFSRFYQENSSDFPMDARELTYFERMRRCYPIHPEIFDRLYEDWATIERFQKTRGVLRLMAAVVYNLWISQDGGLLIMPGSMPLFVSNVREELTRYLNDNWAPIVEREVDGEQSVPYQKDKDTPRFGKCMAARRVARTIMLGSAPSTRSDKIRGLESSRIRLGAVQPGESVATFNDALATLQGSLSYLYSNPSNDRFWYDTRPTLRKTVEDRATQRSNDEVEGEIEARLRKLHCVPQFGRLHICPASSDKVSDDQNVGLVILPTDAVYRHNDKSDSAISAASDILEHRGTIPRNYKNMLAFIAPDANAMIGLKQGVRLYLAWKSVQKDSKLLNLDATQNDETDNALKRCDQIVDERINEAYCWLIVPYMDLEYSNSEIIWESTNIRGKEDMIGRAVQKMEEKDELIERLAPMILRMHLDDLLWQGKNEINVGYLWQLMCTYCYLPRLTSFSVLQATITDGVRDGSFGYAEVFTDGKYRGLRHDCELAYVDRSGWLIDQVPEEEKKPEYKAGGGTVTAGGGTLTGGNEALTGGGGTITGGDGTLTGGASTAGSQAGGKSIEPPSPPPRPVNRHFAMSTSLEPTRITRTVNTLMEEVINHLISIDGADVEIRLSVEAKMPDGTQSSTVRTVTENCRTLRVDDFGFDD